MTNKTLEALKQARSLLAAGWCQRTQARNREGAPVRVESHEAVSFCAMGALRRAIKGATPAENWSTFNKSYDLLDNVACEVSSGITHYNDTASDVREVLDLYDRAIAKAEAALR